MIHMSDPPETSELLAFTKTIEAHSLSRAAAELGAPRATIGRRLARLEEKLGVRLLRRSTRALALTDAGEAFYRHARIVLDALAQAEASVETDEELRGTVRIAVPPMLDRSFGALVAEFARAHPHVQLQVNVATRHVDLLREGYDLALRAANELDAGLVARIVARAQIVALASPAYLRRRGTPRRVEDLANHDCLLGFARGEVPATHWPLLRGGRVAVRGSFLSNDITLLADAALRGLGITLLPTMLVGKLVTRGDLVHVLPELVGAESRVAIVYPERELLPAQVRAFLDVLAAWAPGALPSMGTRCAEGEVPAAARPRPKAKPKPKRARRR